MDVVVVGDGTADRDGDIGRDDRADSMELRLDRRRLVLQSGHEDGNRRIADHAVGVVKREFEREAVLQALHFMHDAAAVLSQLVPLSTVVS